MNMSKRWKREFVRDWIAAWNAHDLDRIMAHYADAIEFTSPFVVKLPNDPGGLVIGKPGLRAYFERGLARYPDLHFRLLHVLPGVASITLFYESVNDLIAAEVMEFDPEGRVARVLAHYAQAIRG